MPFGFGMGRGKGRWKRGWSLRRGRGIGVFWPPGVPMNCICPNCGLIVPYQPDTPCYQKKCPKCGSPMTRQIF